MRSLLYICLLYTSGPTTYIKALNSVASESYPQAFTAATTITVNSVGGTRTITYQN